MTDPRDDIVRELRKAIRLVEDGGANRWICADGGGMVWPLTTNEVMKLRTHLNILDKTSAHGGATKGDHTTEALVEALKLAHRRLKIPGPGQHFDSYDTDMASIEHALSMAGVEVADAE